MHRRPVALVAVVLAALLALTACRPVGTSSAGGPTILRIGASVEPTTLDGQANNAAAIPQVLLYNVYQTLVKMDGDGKLVPSLATTYEVSTDRLVYTFKLDPTARFSSGNKVTAADVVASLDRVRHNAENKVLATQMSVVADLKAPSEDTVVVRLARPSNMWLYDISSTAGMVVELKAGVNLAEATAGSGPYRLKEWRRGSSITLERNPSYGGAKPHYDEVTFRYFTDATALNNAMASGDLDIISNVQAPQSISQFSDASRFTVIEGTTNGEVVLGLNNTAGPLANVKVRQAISYAIDRKALLETVWNGKGTLIGSMVPPTDPWYEDLSNVYPYDVAKAKELLAASGVSGPITLRLRVPNLAYATSSAQFIASSLKEVGIQVTVDTLEFPARWLDQVYAKGDYDMTIVAHVEPRDIVNYANPAYYWHYRNPEFAKLVEEADAGTPEVQVAKLKQAAKLLSTDAASVWLFLLPNLIVTKTGITGVNKNLTSLSFDVTGVSTR